MARIHVVIDVSSGPNQPVRREIPFTPEEEAAADAADALAAALPPIVPIEDRLSALETVLVQKSIVTQADLDTAVDVAAQPAVGVK